MRKTIAAFAATLVLLGGTATMGSLSLTTAANAAWYNTQCVVFLQNGGQIAVVNAHMFESCQSAGKKCAADVGIGWSNITFYSNWAAVDANPNNYVCSISY